MGLVLEFEMWRHFLIPLPKPELKFQVHHGIKVGKQKYLCSSNIYLLIIWTNVNVCIFLYFSLHAADRGPNIPIFTGAGPLLQNHQSQDDGILLVTFFQHPVKPHCGQTIIISNKYWGLRLKPNQDFTISYIACNSTTVVAPKT